MNYNFLEYNKPLTFNFKPIGFALVFICVAAGCYLNISSSETIFDFTIRAIPIIYFMALAMILQSKSKIEDERSEELKLQIVKHGYIVLIFTFLIFEIGATDGEPLGNNSMFYVYFTSILGLQVILFTALQHGQMIDLIIERKLFYKIAVLIILMTLFFINKWLWTI